MNNLSLTPAMLAKIINSLGFDFDEGLEVQGRISVSDLFSKSKARCGIYLLSFSDNTYYIGQATDVVKRFSQHRKKYSNVEMLWFQPVSKKTLNDLEKLTIAKAERSGLLLTNKSLVTNIIGDTDLDLIITPNEQEEWLEKNKNISNEGFDLYSKIDLKYILKYKYNFEKFKQLREYKELKKILNLYITKCIPAYKKTEMSFWSLSCLPSTNQSARYFCLNVNFMEVFVVGCPKKTDITSGFIVTTYRFLNDEKDIDRIYKKYKTVDLDETSHYRAAGDDQVRIRFSDLKEFENLLMTENDIVDSIKEMNLRLMRKGGTIYSRYHCFDLVKDVLE